MNTQLQRMMVVLFLVLTLIAVTVLFWLPINNDSDRILVARENASNGLLNLGAQEQDTQNGKDSSMDDMLSSEFTGPKSESFETGDSMRMEDNENSLYEQDLIADDAELRREYDPASYLGNGMKAGNMQNLNMDKDGKNGAVSMLPGGMSMKAMPKKSITMSKEMMMDSDIDGYAYDVMGNKRAHVTDYTVRKNDWFAKITGKHWEDLFMWPDLYTMNINNLSSNNPDLIFPDEKISVYESLTADGDFSADDRRTLISAYLKVYKIYKQLGKKKDLAAAQLLASAVRYDQGFLEKYSGIIASKDKREAERLLKEQKFLD